MSENTSSWSNAFIKKITEKTEKTISEWIVCVNNLGLDETQRNNWMNIFESNVEDLYSDILSDVRLKQNQLIQEIEELLKKLEHICKTLQIRMPSYGKLESNLCFEKAELLQNIKKYESMIEETKSKITKLQKKEIELSRCLGVEAKQVRESPLLSQTEIETYREHIESLEQEKYARTERFCEIQSKIMELIQDLQYKPSDRFEKMITENDQEFLYTDENMKKLETYHIELVLKKQTIIEDVDNLREKIRSLSIILDENLQSTNEFLDKHTDYSYTCLDALKVELNRLEELKHRNINTFVEKLREEITIMWEKCHFTPQQKMEFIHFKDDNYTENLLSIHDIELNKLKTFYTKNSKLLTLLEKWQELWLKVQTLEEKQTVDRFKNRAGQLLQEEKERRQLSSRIPKIEEELLRLAEEYEIANGKTFLSFGRNISEIIQQNHEERNNEKKKKAAKRKQEPPSNAAQQNKLQIYNPNTPAKSAKKAALYTPSAKKIKTTNKENVNTAPPKMQNSVRRRISNEREKRIKNCRKLAKSQYLKENNNQMNCTREAIKEISYNEFERNLSGDCRSTIYVKSDASPLATPLPTTPSKSTFDCTKQLTPRTLRSKSPASKSRLAPSTATGLQLLF